ncbi:glycosyltransferase family 2 protein [Vibrio cholerae]|uniref:glycosyltransferase family 2 protein n=1 Tax=Vibrio cholerae TaxID=666 RepID=UPI00187E6250|nr:glycosyltransferase [Vibrio cholerae]MBF8949157.1 glycosyltransferase family 2 protein [Vibrio cholerae]MBF8956711.1 glycosyltransferase family 2 protein [Vibrio cholerae]MBF8960066.1 glycosyltransferase family 2 protein [Vibrio cholerae]MBF8967825.1 glycosyltransferase family 2 protein [Vibrio cholerae]MBF8973427.1 glycosyltransferase family 2 protein [Vibrio cholerae]
MEIVTTLITIPLIAEFLSIFILMLIFWFNWKPAKVLNNLPSVTVFVPFYNEEPELIIEALTKIDQQSYSSKLQVIIINDGSTNKTPLIVSQWINSFRKQNYILLNRPHNSGRKGAALDYALDKNIATGDIYIVVDSDTFIEPNEILALANKIWSHPEYAAVCGYIVPKNRSNNILCQSQFYEHLGVHGAIRTSQDHLGIVPVLAGAFVAHRASVVHEIGGWSEWLVEDISWCWRALANRYRTGYTAEALATTHCPNNRDALFRQRRRWSRGRVEAFAEAWKVSPLTGLISLPWFLMSATEFLFPPLFIAMPIFALFDMWLPLSIMATTLLLEAFFIFLFIRKTGNSHGLSMIEILILPIFTHLLRLVTWIPNILGYFDEILGKEKKWLTR